MFSFKSGDATWYSTSSNDFTTANLSGASDITILGNITLSANVGTNEARISQIKVAKTATLNLGTYTLYVKSADNSANNNEKSGIVIDTADVTLTVEGTTGAIDHYTNKISYPTETDKQGSYVKDTIKKNREIAAIGVGKSAENQPTGIKAGLVINGGTIKSNGTAICAGNGTNITITNGTVESTYACGIYIGNAKNTTTGYNYDSTRDDIALNISGGTVKSAETSNLPAIQVSGTLSYNKTTINITGGTIEYANKESLIGSDNKAYGNPDAIYAGGNVALNVSGGTITSGGTGVELRAGNMSFTGGTITSTATQYLVNENKSSSSGGQVYGAAISIAQHSTNKDIAVNVSGEASAKGQVALAVENPIDNKAGNTISAEIDGGTFESTAAGTSAIAAKASDSRSTININGAVTFKGTVEKTVADSGTSGSSSITFGENADVTVVTKKTVVNDDGTTSEVEVTEKYDSTTVQYTETWTSGAGTADSLNHTETYPVNLETWTTSHEDPQKKFFYFTTNSEVSKNAAARAILAPKTSGADETTLLFKTDLQDSYNEVINLDLDHSLFGGLFGSTSKLKTLDASGIVNKIKANITGNDKITSILGSAGNDTIKAGTTGVSIDGGAGDDSLIGSESGNNFFFYSGGSDSISNYNVDKDTVSLKSGAAPIDFEHINFTGSQFVISLGSSTTDSLLTFQGSSAVKLSKDNNTYSYKANSKGIEYVAFDSTSDHNISLGAGYTSNYDGSKTVYSTIDGSKTDAINITGNDKDNFILGGKGGGKLEGNDGNDIIKANTDKASLKATLDGGEGSDSLYGGTGKDLFIYTSGKDTVANYGDSDLVSVKTSSNIKFEESTVTAETKEDSKTNVIVGFGTADSLVFEDVKDDSAISVQSGKNLYVYGKDNVVLNDKEITLTSVYTGASFDASAKASIEAINASAAQGSANAISITGNDKDNVIIGSAVTGVGNSIGGGAGNDNITGNDKAADVFIYTSGSDIIENFGFNKVGDSLSIDTANIKSVKESNGRLTISMNKKNNKLTLKLDDDAPERISLAGGDYFTKNGVASGKNFKLFAGAKGEVSIAEGITSVNASAIKDYSVTVVAGSVESGQVLNLNFAGDNKKKDGFVYGGGNVSISGYEAGKDKINLNDTSIIGFSVKDDKTVAVSVGSGVISIAGAQGKQVLIHDATSKGNNSYSKLVFAETGVLQDKDKKPTSVTLSSGATNYTVGDTNTTIKKISVTDIDSAISVTAGDKTNTIIDASATAVGVSLIGGAKNDKITGSKQADTFVYTGGKDIIYGFDNADSISLGNSVGDIGDAKITASKKSIKFKFSGKNTLTIKGDALNGSLHIDDTDYIYAKNAIADGEGSVSLTSQFSGTYKIGKNEGTKVVDGHLAEKNLTLKGTEKAETFTGGKNKTTFKGGGGADTLTGGAGKDTFFYAKGDKDTVTIANFDFAKDKLKVANGTIEKISNSTGVIKFGMNSGKKNDDAIIGGFNITSSKDSGTIDASKVLIKANNTYYWFAQGDVTEKVTVGGGEQTVTVASANDLITWSDKKITSAQAKDYDVIDLGYSTNLAKSGVAIKVSSSDTGANFPTKKS